MNAIIININNVVKNISFAFIWLIFLNIHYIKLIVVINFPIGLIKKFIIPIIGNNIEIIFKIFLIFITLFFDLWGEKTIIILV